MRVVVVTSPAPLLDPPTIRQRLGITSDDGDENLAAYIQAATDELDGPGGWLGRALGPQLLELQAGHFPGQCWSGPIFSDFARFGGPDRSRDPYCSTITLPYPEIATVVSVTYLDDTGIMQTLDPSQYLVSGRGVFPAYGTSWPAVRMQPGAVAIRYTAGYVAGKAPEAIKQVITMRVAQMNASNRPDPSLKQESVVGVSSQQWDTSTGLGESFDKTVARLLAPYQVFM